MNTVHHEEDVFSLTATKVHFVEKKKTQLKGVSQNSLLKIKKSKAIKRKRKSDRLIKSQTLKKDFINHDLDKSLLEALANGNVSRWEKWQDLFDPFNPAFNGITNQYQYFWGTEEVNKLWTGTLDRSLVILRECQDLQGEVLDEELNWMASQQFDMVTTSFNIDPNIIREGIYTYFKDRINEFSQENQKLLLAFHNAYKVLTAENIQLTTVERNYVV